MVEFWQKNHPGVHELRLLHTSTEEAFMRPGIYQLQMITNTGATLILTYASITVISDSTGFSGSLVMTNETERDVYPISQKILKEKPGTRLDQLMFHGKSTCKP